MAYYDSWSENPPENNAAPPLGAGEDRMNFDMITDTFRVVMAAIKQLANVVDALGDMADQNANNVNISGGTIGGTVAISADRLTSGKVPLDRLETNLTGKNADGLTTAALQAMYNRIYPVGRVMLWHTTDLVSSGLTWAGVTATWVTIDAAADMVLVVAGTMVGPSQGAGSVLLTGTGQTTDDGVHDHGGSTDNVALTSAHLPTPVLTYNRQLVESGNDVNVVISTATLGYSGTPGGVHAHAVPSQTAHHHTLTRDIARFGVVIVQRTA